MPFDLGSVEQADFLQAYRRPKERLSTSNSAKFLLDDDSALHPRKCSGMEAEI
jgi:hypothetical protein